MATAQDHTTEPFESVRSERMADPQNVQKFYALVDIEAGIEIPWGLMSQSGAIVLRWIPNKHTWVEAPRHWDYLIGREPGAREISEQQAEKLKTATTLKFMPDDAIQWISH